MANNYTSDNLTHIAAGSHLSGTLAVKIGNDVFVAGNIQSGTDVSNDNVTSADVVSGKYFHTSDGVQHQGAMSAGSMGAVSVSVDSATGVVSATASAGAGYYTSAVSAAGSAQLDVLASSSYMPTTSDIVISGGKFLTGDQTISGDANLVASNIASGVTIFNVSGTHEGGGGSESLTQGYLINTSGTVTFQPISGGTAKSVTAVKTYNLPDGVAEPAYSGGETTFYKCATVTLAGSTASWTGYELTIAASGITYASTVTSGLTFSATTPVVNGIYDDGVTKRIYEDTLLASNIKKDISLFGVTGTYEGESLTQGYFINTSGTITFQPNSGGTAEAVSAIKTFSLPTGVNEPEYSSGGSATNFYKCAAVTSGDSSWTGYKAILSSGVYSFESTVTSGLSYSTITPVISRCYTDGALVRAILWEGLPTEGLVFYASLTESMTEAETGQTMTATGSPELTTYLGVPCLYVTGSDSLHTAFFSTLPTGTVDRTLSVWMYTTSAGWAWAMSYGCSLPYAEASGKGQGIGVTSAYYPVYSQNDDLKWETSVQGRWVHVVGVVSNQVKTLYIDGELKSTGSLTTGTAASMGVYLGSTGDYEFFNGYIAAPRIYNRVLSQDEITALFNEFTPTA